MKKLIILLALFIGFGAYANAQLDPDLSTNITLATDTLNGLDDTETFYSPFLGPYWDYSVQFKSTFYGVGDSSCFAVATYRTNDPAMSVWEEITAERDTLNTTTDVQSVTIEVTDFTGVWLKHILTMITPCEDTVWITPYCTMKVKRVID